MTSKKTDQANLENKKSVFVLMGFVIVLALLFIAFEWSNSNKSRGIFDTPISAIIDDDIIPITMPEKVIPPPPPIQVVEKFNVVKHDILPPLIDVNSEIDPTEKISDVMNTYVPEPTENSDEIIMIPEIMPEFIGNVFEFLSKNIKYPTIAQEIGLQGKVICQFVVNKNGSIVDVEVVRSIDKSLDDEALRVIKSMPNWKPGRQNGKPVRVKFTLPVNFKLM